MRAPTHNYSAARARWLAELAEALDDARRLTNRLGAAEGRIEAVELYARIEAVRLEIEALRRTQRVSGAGTDQEWSNLMPWQGRSAAGF